jgi:histone H3/H4
MPRYKVKAESPKKEPQVLKGEKACTYSFRIPLDLALSLEGLLHQRVVRSLSRTGLKTNSSASEVLRECLERFLPILLEEEAKLQAEDKAKR